MSETEYASQRNCRFDDCLYADDGFIAELPVSYRTENLGKSYYRTENHRICHFLKHGKSQNFSLKRRFSMALSVYGFFFNRLLKDVAVLLCKKI